MTELENRCINTIRMLSADAVEKANSGHPGMPMGAAAAAFVLWARFLKHNPNNPDWPDRDRFVLLAGHGSMLLYSLLHLTGYDLPLEELKNFRQWGSRTPGHPEHGHTPGVETTTGPLGQGFGNGVGMALAEQYLAARFNRPGYTVIDHYTYGIVSDGDLMEGVSHEAASLASHLGLGKLIYIYDDNRISIEGGTDIAFTEDRGARFKAYGWQVIDVPDGNDIAALDAAIQSARQMTDKPSLIVARTHIGFGSPGKQDSPGAHGEPLGAEELRHTKENLGWPLEPDFYIPNDVLPIFREAVAAGAAAESRWQERFSEYARAFPELAAELNQWLAGGLPEDWGVAVPEFPPDAKGMATRVASGKVLNAIGVRITNLVGGSADLAPSTKTLIADAPDFQKGAYQGLNLRFGVREHAMGSILNGMALHGGLIPYGATFLVFSDYMRPPIRLAALMGIHVIYVFTHDSIGLGEDGPTHQPIEHLASLRAIPNLTVIRPADANETGQAWIHAVSQNSGPVALVLTRQGLPVLDRERFPSAEGLLKGGYVLEDPSDGQPDVLLMASGSEVAIAMAAATQLAEEDILSRVVSMPSWELFDAQSDAYRDSVLPPAISARIAIEAGSPQGWHRYVGSGGRVIGIERFGASAPFQEIYEHFGLTRERVVRVAHDILSRS